MEFGDFVAVDQLSFEVHEGEVFGFLGSNGSGKTTTIRALLGAYEPTAGRLLVDGERFSPRRSRILGYLPEERGVYPKERVIDVMTYFGRLRGLSNRAARAESLAYLERVGIGDKAKSTYEKLSGGQQQKVQLGVTILNDPSVLILDEPTKGLDPVNRRLLLEIVEERRSAGAAVIYVTHDMDEVERLCDRILLLRRGKAVASGTVREVVDRFEARRLAVDHAAPLPVSSSYEIVEDAAGRAVLAPSDDVSDAELLQELVAAGAQVSRFDNIRPRLDDVFVRMYADDPLLADQDGAAQRKQRS